MKNLLCLIFLLLPSLLFSQDLTGIWRGHFQSNNSSMLERIYGVEDRYKFEIQLDQRSKNFSGVTYSYKTPSFMARRVAAAR